jgi:hypothetical protein
LIKLGRQNNKKKCNKFYKKKLYRLPYTEEKKERNEVNEMNKEKKNLANVEQQRESVCRRRNAFTGYCK